MDGEAEDITLTKLMKSVINTIAKNSPNKSVVLEVELLSHIQIWQRSDAKTVPEVQ